MSSESSQCYGSKKFHGPWHGLGNIFHEAKVSSNNIVSRWISYGSLISSLVYDTVRRSVVDADLEKFPSHPEATVECLFFPKVMWMWPNQWGNTQDVWYWKVWMWDINSLQTLWERQLPSSWDIKTARELWAYRYFWVSLPWEKSRWSGCHFSSWSPLCRLIEMWYWEQRGKSKYDTVSIESWEYQWQALKLRQPFRDWVWLL